VATLVEEEDSYYSEHSDNGEELKEAYKTLYVEYEKLRKVVSSTSVSFCVGYILLNKITSL
jgi:hypothetical protein